MCGHQSLPIPIFEGEQPQRSMTDVTAGRLVSTSPMLIKGGDKSTGFVLKLYQMVNGAPDDILSWTSNGESFRISDLSRLESETLPGYFRHGRFQSLVRQLNFYNFRKVNRERNFWIYHHPLFHRDRPQDLKKLRRRTCPGFDGRKQRIHRSSTGEEQNVMEAPLTSSATVSPAATTNLVSPGSVAKVSRSPSPSSQNSVERKMVTANIPFYRSVSSASSIETPDRSPFHRHDNVSREHNEDCTAHLQIVSQVSRDLNGICSDLSSKRGQRRGMDMCFGLDKPEVHYSKIKCDLLTYDDEFGQKDQERVVFEKSTMPSLPRERFDLTPPSSDEAIAISITSALCQQNTSNLGSNASREKDVPFAILMFLLTTHPQDPNILSKIHAELICNPSLREEFHAYSQALDGTDLKQVWCNFARNEVHPLMKSTFYNYKVMPEEKMNVFHKCYALWFDAT